MEPERRSPDQREPEGNQTFRPPRRLVKSLLAAATLGLVTLSPHLEISHSHAQQVTGMRASHFRVQLETYPPPFERQIKTLLEGSQAEPQPGGKVLLSQPSLKYFTTNGTVEVQARSANCLFDTMSHNVSSTNILQVEMANGKFYTEGRGFLMRRTNNSIFLSNEVHTVIRLTARKSLKP
ncbi:MAG: hypothetical protein H7Y43_12835 [Akkermansiaceae bacterium]|nr:hypothetical protein [Verrucomicrobiales bacterium]